jgi:mannose-6-phosphate isomerase
MVDCPYFTTDFLPLDGELKINKTGETFTVYMCVEDSFELHTSARKFSYNTGDTVLVPAGLQEFTLHGNASLLEIYIS